MISIMTQETRTPFFLREFYKKFITADDVGREFRLPYDEISSLNLLPGPITEEFVNRQLTLATSVDARMAMLRQLISSQVWLASNLITIKYFAESEAPAPHLEEQEVVTLDMIAEEEVALYELILGELRAAAVPEPIIALGFHKFIGDLEFTGTLISPIITQFIGRIGAKVDRE
jgi:hypothetical protein